MRRSARTGARDAVRAGWSAERVGVCRAAGTGRQGTGSSFEGCWVGEGARAGVGVAGRRTGCKKRRRSAAWAEHTDHDSHLDPRPSFAPPSAPSSTRSQPVRTGEPVRACRYRSRSSGRLTRRLLRRTRQRAALRAPVLLPGPDHLACCPQVRRPLPLSPLRASCVCVCVLRVGASCARPRRLGCNDV